MVSERGAVLSSSEHREPARSAVQAGRESFLALTTLGLALIARAGPRLGHLSDFLMFQNTVIGDARTPVSFLL